MASVFNNLLKLFPKNPKTKILTDKDVPKTSIFIPYVTGIIGVIRAGGATKFHKFIDSRHKKLGPIFREHVTEDTVFITDPLDMRKVFTNEGKSPKHTYPNSWKVYNQLKGIKRGIFFMDDDEWATNRRIMNQVMLKMPPNYFMKPCQNAAELLTNRLESKCENGEIVNLSDVLYQWSVESVVSIMLGNNYKATCNLEISSVIAELTEIMQQVFPKTAIVEGLPTKLALKLQLKPWTDFERTMDLALAASNKVAESISKYYAGGDGVMNRLLEGGMKRELEIPIVTDLLLAAGDTSVHAMEWMLYSLAKHPEIQQQIYNETAPVDSMVEPPPILKNVVREALRLYPIAPFLNRRLQTDLTIQGYKLKKDTLIAYSMYSSCRDPKYFRDPEKFWPDRWIRMEDPVTKLHKRDAAHPIASIPFALGARSCVGKKMSEQLVYVTIAKILEKYELSLRNTKDVEVALQLVVVPSEPIRLAIHPRK